MQDGASLNPSPAPDDPQGMLHLCGVFLEYLRVRNYSPRTVYNRGRQLAAFRRFLRAPRAEPGKTGHAPSCWRIKVICSITAKPAARRASGPTWPTAGPPANR